jgi:hypothetical protein
MKPAAFKIFLLVQVCVASEVNEASCIEPASNQNVVLVQQHAQRVAKEQDKQALAKQKPQGGLGLQGEMTGLAAGVALDVGVVVAVDFVGGLFGDEAGEAFGGFMAGLGFGSADATNNQVIDEISEVKAGINDLNQKITAGFNDLSQTITAGFNETITLLKKQFNATSKKLNKLQSSVDEGIRNLTQLLLRHRSEQATMVCERTINSIRGMLTQIKDYRKMTMQTFATMESVPKNLKKITKKEEKRMKDIWKAAKMPVSMLSMTRIDEEVLNMKDCLLGTQESESALQKFMAYMKNASLTAHEKLDLATQYFMHLNQVVDEAMVVLLVSRILMFHNVQSGLDLVATQMVNKRESFSHFWTTMLDFFDAGQCASVRKCKPRTKTTIKDYSRDRIAGGRNVGFEPIEEAYPCNRLDGDCLAAQKLGDQFAESQKSIMKTVAGQLCSIEKYSCYETVDSDDGECDPTPCKTGGKTQEQWAFGAEPPTVAPTFRPLPRPRASLAPTVGPTRQPTRSFRNVIPGVPGGFRPTRRTRR